MVRYLFSILLVLFSFESFALNFTEVRNGNIVNLQLTCNQTSDNICQNFPQKFIDSKTKKIVFKNYKSLNSFEIIKNLSVINEKNLEIIAPYDLLDFLASSNFRILNDQSIKNALAIKSRDVYLKVFDGVCLSNDRSIIFSYDSGNLISEFLICQGKVYRFSGNSNFHHLELNNNIESNLSFEEYWSVELEPFLNINCQGDYKSFCQKVCNVEADKSCSIPMPVCRDCIGTSLLITNIFESMGIRYRNSGNHISNEVFSEYLSRKQFVTFSSKSVYNHVDSYDSQNLRNRFKSLCTEEIESPIVFFDINPKGNRLGKVRFLACGSTIYEMTDEALIDGELKLFQNPIFRLY